MATRKLAEGLFADEAGACRCSWCESTPAYRKYHDTEWGFPVADDRRLFEKVCLEGFQSGLSWLTILNKREAFRKGFANFEVEKRRGRSASRARRCAPSPCRPNREDMDPGSKNLSCPDLIRHPRSHAGTSVDQEEAATPW